MAWRSLGEPGHRRTAGGYELESPAGPGRQITGGNLIFNAQRLERVLQLPSRGINALRVYRRARQLTWANLCNKSSVVHADGPVVSLTTHGHRLRTVYLTIESIAAGTVLPSRLILWLDQEKAFHALPYSLLQLQRRGLEVRLASNFGPHTKYYPYLESTDEFTLPMVTADDDILYPRYWLQGLVEGYAERSDLIHCYRARVIRLRQESLASYEDWPLCHASTPAMHHFATGVSGVIYPPAFLSILKRNGRRFESCCPRADDLWLHVQALRAGYKVRQLARRPRHFLVQADTQHMALQRFNRGDHESGNDQQAAMTYNPEDLRKLGALSPKVSRASRGEQRRWKWMAILLGLLATGATLLPLPSRAAPGALATITVDPTPGIAIPANFMGLTHEWGEAQNIMGDSTVGVNPIYRNLLTNLAAYGSAPVVIRVGGNSSDTSGEPRPGIVRPFAELFAATGSHFYLGVNLAAHNLPLAMDQTRTFVSGMPRGSLDAIEIGNEPDAYIDRKMRPQSYQFGDYLQEFNTWRDQVFPLLNSPTRIIGPSWGGTGSLKNTARFLEAEHNYLYAFSTHLYVSNVCNGKTNPKDILLTLQYVVGGPNDIRKAAALAHSYGLPLRLDETNSIACGGQEGVSNTFSSSLWAIEHMFQYASFGVDGINWQSPNGASYSPTNFKVITTGKGRTYQLIGTVRPIYYGLLFFQAATGKHAHLVSLNLATTTNLEAWATVDGIGVVRVAVLNKSSDSAGMIRMAMPGYKSATILRLTAPSLDAKQGVTFAGQTLDSTPDGRLQGTKSLETVKPGRDAFEIHMPAASAFIAEFQK